MGGLLQFFMVIFILLRSGSVSSLTWLSKYAIVLFVITVNVWSSQTWAATCRRPSPIHYVDVPRQEKEPGGGAVPGEYLPDVLKGCVGEDGNAEVENAMREH